MDFARKRSQDITYEIHTEMCDAQRCSELQLTSNPHVVFAATSIRQDRLQLVVEQASRVDRSGRVAWLRPLHAMSLQLRVCGRIHLLSASARPCVEVSKSRVCRTTARCSLKVTSGFSALLSAPHELGRIEPEEPSPKTRLPKGTDLRQEYLDIVFTPPPVLLSARGMAYWGFEEGEEVTSKFHSRSHPKGQLDLAYRRPPHLRDSTVASPHPFPA